MKEDGIPFNIVLESNFDISKVSITPNIITHNTTSADTIDEIAPVK